MNPILTLCAALVGVSMGLIVWFGRAIFYRMYLSHVAWVADTNQRFNPTPIDAATRAAACNSQICRWP